MPGSPKPVFRKLRVYAIDPSLAAAHETAEINELTLSIPWENNPGGIPGLDPGKMIGPIGTYLEVVDHDPVSDCVYSPVDLNETFVLANNGLTPSELNPQFHQQMVYAISMKTIDHFERALGRVALWAPRWLDGKKTFVDRLRIYPHALREANAYYHPGKVAVLFGYFPAPEGSDIAAGTTVFTCLSHDVVAHEVTHALLDGLHERFSEPTNVDVLAFHEGFADIVALFQHFANPEVLRDQIAKTRGDLEQQNMLAELAQQFGRATNRGKALRDALGYTDKKGAWHRFRPNPSYLQSATEPHDRGAVLVAAIFEAFLKMYKARVVDLLRIASQGTGVLPAGELHPDLVKRLADEAAKSASHILQMCIRALDYCPPVDITFGDYLRALVTSDYDLYPEDEHNYRTAVLQAFSQYGIRPRSLRNLSLEGLLLPNSMTTTGGHSTLGAVSLEWDNETDRREAFEAIQPNAKLIHDWLEIDAGNSLLGSLGIIVDPKAPASVWRSKGSNLPAFEVHSVRTALRRGSKTNLVPDLVIEITQRRRGFFNMDDQKKADAGDPIKGRRKESCDFWFRRGCTLVVNQRARLVRWMAKTPGDICDDAEMDKVRSFLLGSTVDELDAFVGPIGPHKLTNQFAIVHRH